MEEEEKIFLTKEQALRIAKFNGDKIHNYLNLPFGLIGADYEKESFMNHLERAEKIEVGGKMCRGMSHALVLIIKGEPYFFEHDEEKLVELLKELGK